MLYLKRWIRLNKAFKTAYPLLESGMYFTDDNFTGLERNVPHDQLNANYVIRILSFCFPRRYIVRSNYPKEGSGNHIGAMKFSGTKLLLSNKGFHQIEKDNFRIFDFENSLISAYFVNEELMEFYLAGSSYFSQFFLTPNVIFVDKDRRLIIEKQIDFIHFNDLDWAQKVAVQLNLMNCYKGMVEKSKIFFDKVNFITFRPFIKEAEEIVDKINNRISKVNDLQNLPFIIQHGDLSLSNILIEKDTLLPYIIDWEHMKQHILFYDVFWFWINEAIWNDNYEMINCLSTDVFDNEMERIIGLIQGPANRYSKEVYFSLVLAEYLNCRILNSDTSIDKDNFLIQRVSGLMKYLD